MAMRAKRRTVGVVAAVFLVNIIIPAILVADTSDNVPIDTTGNFGTDPAGGDRYNRDLMMKSNVTVGERTVHPQWAMILQGDVSEVAVENKDLVIKPDLAQKVAEAKNVGRGQALLLIRVEGSIVVAHGAPPAGGRTTAPAAAAPAQPGSPAPSRRSGWWVQYNRGETARVVITINASPSGHPSSGIVPKGGPGVVTASARVCLIGKTPTNDGYQVDVEDSTGAGTVGFPNGATVTLGKTGQTDEFATVDLSGMDEGQTDVKAYIHNEPAVSGTATATVFVLDLNATGMVSTDASGGYVVMRKDGADSYTNDTFTTGGDKEIDNDKVWEDTDYDDTPETADPVCYTIGKTAKLKASVMKITSLAGNLAIKMKVDATPAGHSGTVDNVVFGPADVTIPANTTSVTVAEMAGNHTVGTVVNNFTYNLEWRYSLDGGTTWRLFQTNTQKVFVLLGEPLAGYCSDSSLTENPLSVDTALARTARRIDWACKVCRGKDAADIVKGASDYIWGQNGFSGSSGFGNPFALLDSGEKHTGDCISLANLATTALRLNHVDARPAKAYCNYRVVDGNNQTYGWTRKLHKYHNTDGDKWQLAFTFNNFEGFFHIGPFVPWTTYPSKGYVVGDEAAVVAPAGKEKYLPTLVLRKYLGGAGGLRWVQDAVDQPDVEWAAPTQSIPGVSLEAYGVHWHSDDANDGEYNVAWDKDAKTLKLHTGAPVAIAGPGTKTLTCAIGTESCSIDVTVTDWALLQAAATQIKTVRIVPARTQADAP